MIKTLNFKASQSPEQRAHLGNGVMAMINRKLERQGIPGYKLVIYPWNDPFGICWSEYTLKNHFSQQDKLSDCMYQSYFINLFLEKLADMTYEFFIKEVA